MSVINCILKSLNIKEENLIFDHDFCDNVKVKSVNSIVYYAKLTTAIPNYCPHCGVSDVHNIIKNGTQTSKIKLPKVSKMNTYLFIRKQRIYCKSCGHSITATTSIVDKRCFISNNTKTSILVDATKKRSEKDIAFDNNVSHNTVNKIINERFNVNKVKRNYLPQHISFDEFKSTKSCTGKMSFIFIDTSNGKIIDILEDRRLHKLIEYFRLYTFAARRSVKSITIDMYSPYISLIKQMFPNAKIIIDKFHIVQLVTRSLNQTRIKLMNSNKENYNKLKRYWRLLLMNEDKLDCIHFDKYFCFKKWQTEQSIVDYLLSIDDEFKATYRLYQDLLSAIKNNDKKEFDRIINCKYDNVSSKISVSLDTLIKYRDYIYNTFEYHQYMNGRIEGTNNLIKCIKRIAFGYRTFKHFRNRIFSISYAINA